MIWWGNWKALHKRDTRQVFRPKIDTKKLVLALDQHLQFLSMSASLNQQCPVKITFHCIINSLDGGSEWQIIPVAVNCVNISIKLPPDDYR